jgi:hypothetical protein
MRTTTLSALALASLGGCALFVVALPWGDPCSFSEYAGGPCPIDVAEPSLDRVRNAAFALICLGTGFAAGKLSPSPRPLVGAVSVFVAVFSAGIVAHVLYRLGARAFSLPTNRWEWTLAVSYLITLAALGAIGVAASMWSPGIRWRRR